MERNTVEKTHKDRNRQKNRMKTEGKRGWFMSRTQTVASPPRAGEPAGTYGHGLGQYSRLCAVHFTQVLELSSLRCFYTLRGDGPLVRTHDFETTLVSPCRCSEFQALSNLVLIFDTQTHTYTYIFFFFFFWGGGFWIKCVFCCCCC